MPALGSHREVTCITDSGQSQVYFARRDWSGVQMTTGTEKRILIVDDNEAVQEMLDRK
jgi:hypothetical protein